MGNGGSSSPSTDQQQQDSYTGSFMSRNRSKLDDNFYYKGKPNFNELPPWFNTIQLTPQELPHLKKHEINRNSQPQILFSHELSSQKLNGELARKIALDCSKRCTFSYKGPVDEFGMPTDNGSQSIDHHYSS